MVYFIVHFSQLPLSLTKCIEREQIKCENMPTRYKKYSNLAQNQIGYWIAEHAYEHEI